MPEFQLSSKYPDGTIAVAKGEAADEVVGAFIAFKKAYEEESNTPAIPTPPAPSAAVSFDQGVANAQAGLGGQQEQPPGLSQNSGDFHPSRVCEVCQQPMKYKVWEKKDGSGKKYKKLECSNDFKHQNQNTWVGWVK